MWGDRLWRQAQGILEAMLRAVGALALAGAAAAQSPSSCPEGWEQGSKGSNCFRLESEPPPVPDGTPCRSNAECATGQQWCGSRTESGDGWDPSWEGDVCQSGECEDDKAAEHFCPRFFIEEEGSDEEPAHRIEPGMAWVGCAAACARVGGALASVADGSELREAAAVLEGHNVAKAWVGNYRPDTNASSWRLADGRPNRQPVDSSFTPGQEWWTKCEEEEHKCAGVTPDMADAMRGHWPNMKRCRDQGNDCCANAAGGEPAECEPGFEPTTQPTSYEECPNYGCRPVGASAPTHTPSLFASACNGHSASTQAPCLCKMVGSGAGVSSAEFNRTLPVLQEDACYSTQEPQPDWGMIMTIELTVWSIFVCIFASCFCCVVKYVDPQQGFKHRIHHCGQDMGVCLLGWCCPCVLWSAPLFRTSLAPFKSFLDTDLLHALWECAGGTSCRGRSGTRSRTRGGSAAASTSGAATSAPAWACSRGRSSDTSSGSAGSSGRTRSVRLQALEVLPFQAFGAVLAWLDLTRSGGVFRP